MSSETKISKANFVTELQKRPRGGLIQNLQGKSICEGGSDTKFARQIDLHRQIGQIWNIGQVLSNMSNLQGKVDKWYKWYK